MPGLRVAVLGCGQIARRVHLPHLRAMPQVDVVSLCETDPAALSQAHSLFPQAKIYQDWRDALHTEAVQAVIVALPNVWHAEAAIQALRADKHVYLEKPLALDQATAQEVLATEQRSKAFAAIGFNYRFHPLFRSLRESLGESGERKPMKVRTEFHSPSPEMPAWKRRRDTGGGVLLDLASHHFDMLRFLFGCEIASVQVRLESRQYEDDCAQVDWVLANGVEGHSRFSSMEETRDYFEVNCSGGSLKVDRLHSLTVERPGVQARHGWAAALGSPFEKRDLLRKLRFPGHDPSFRLALEAFVRGAKGEPRESPTLTDGMRSLEVVLAAEKSAKIGGPVALP